MYFQNDQEFNLVGYCVVVIGKLEGYGCEDGLKVGYKMVLNVRYLDFSLYLLELVGNQYRFLIESQDLCYFMIFFCKFYKMRRRRKKEKKKKELDKDFCLELDRNRKKIRNQILEFCDQYSMCKNRRFYLYIICIR